VRKAALTFDEALQAAQVGEVWATLDQLVETLKTVWYQVLFDPEITDKRVACEAAAADFGLGGQTVGKPRDRGGDPSGRDGHAETAGARHGRGDRDEPAEVRGPGVGIVVKGPPDPAGRDLLSARRHPGAVMRRPPRLAGLLAVALLALTGPAAAQQGLLLRAAARTASGTGAAVDTTNVESAAIVLNVTAAATDVGDTLNVYVQSSADGGTTWDDFVSFTQLLGTGGAKMFVASWARAMAPETEHRAPADATLTQTSVLQGPVGGKWRVKWVIVDAGTVNASFTFSVTASLRGLR